VRSTQIRTADGSRACQFPQHSTPMISVGTGCGICEYECDETFRKRDGKCVCEESLYECNGKCTSVRDSGWLFKADTRLTTALALWVIGAGDFSGVVQWAAWVGENFLEVPRLLPDRSTRISVARPHSERLTLPLEPFSSRARANTLTGRL